MEEGGGMDKRKSAMAKRRMTKDFKKKGILFLVSMGLYIFIISVLTLAICGIVWFAERGERQQIKAQVQQQAQTISELRFAHELVPILEQILTPRMKDEFGVLVEKLNQEHRKKGNNK